MGSLAPQGTIVVVIIVMRRSDSFSMVFVAMMPGTPHPELMSMGMKLFPESPNFLNTRSMTKATRLM